MKHQPTNLDEIDTTLIRSYKIIDLLLISFIAFAPFVFGAVLAWREEAMLILTTAIFICFLFKLSVEGDSRFVWSWVYVPLALFLLFVAVKHISLLTSIGSAFSPKTAAVKKICVVFQIGVNYLN